MASNDISNLSSVALPLLTARMGAQLEAHAALYPTIEPLSDLLDSRTAILNASNNAVETAKAAYQQAIQKRGADRRALASTAAEVARLAYATPLSDDLIAGLGLSPRSTSRAKILPATPQGLVATPSVDGDVRLEWTSGAPKKVRYIVEGQAADGGWAYLIDVGSTKVTLSDYAPGVPAAFRIRASANGTLSAPSNEATIYPSSPALRVVDGGERKAA